MRYFLYKNSSKSSSVARSKNINTVTQSDRGINHFYHSNSQPICLDFYMFFAPFHIYHHFGGDFAFLLKFKHFYPFAKE